VDRLDQWAEEVADRIQDQHAGHFHVFKAIVSFAYDFVEGLAVESSDQRRVVATTLFLRLFQAVRSVAVLARYGRRQDATALLRISFETLVLLTNACRTDGFAERYVLDVKRRSVRLLKKSLKDHAGLLDDERRQFFEEKKREIEEQIKSEQVTRVPSVEQLASKVGMTAYYDLVYSQASEAVHPSITSLEQYLERSEDGRIEALVTGEDTSKVAFQLYSASDFLLHGISVAAELFGTELDADLKDHRKKLEEAFKDLKEAGA
jgi:hypothetical protein